MNKRRRKTIAGIMAIVLLACVYPSFPVYADKVSELEQKLKEEKEKKKEKSAWRKRAGSVKIMLTVLLLASLGLMIMAISFASATLMVISLASMAVLCAAYFLTVPRR